MVKHTHYDITAMKHYCEVLSTPPLCSGGPGLQSQPTHHIYFVVISSTYPPPPHIHSNFHHHHHVHEGLGVFPVP